jgi:hypothetical protein
MLNSCADLTGWFAALAFGLVEVATAAPAKVGATDPTDAGAAVPTLVYKAPLASYRSLRDDAPVDWRQANETVRAIGGWRAYAREAAQGASAPAPRFAPAPAPVPAPVPATVSRPASAPAAKP